MAHRSIDRYGRKRQPLSEIRNPAVTSPLRHVKTPKAGAASLPLAHHLPHNESLEANGSLAVRSSNPSSPDNKRASRAAVENERSSKRDSAISTTSTNTARRKTYIGPWQLGKTIGRGGCSRVRVVRHRFRDQYGAVKIIARSDADASRAQSLANLVESSKGGTFVPKSGCKPLPFGLEREIAVMKLLEHPNIVTLYDVWENRNELYLIMEYVDGGELFHYVDERKGLPEDETVYLFRQIVSALLYCHGLLICHRDLKPENILLSQADLTVKLIDFGMAGLQPEGRLLSTPCGSPHYAAPEVVSARPYDGRQADVWSCGVILYVMLTGTTPFNYDSNANLQALFSNIRQAAYYMPPGLSTEAKDLLRRIFVPDPKRRITMDGVWGHPFLHKFDKQFGFEGEAGTKEAAVGPAPSIEKWTVKRIQDIDREILQNMRTLWHSEPEQHLITKLLSPELNHEKVFYAALVKHRDEHLENYLGFPDYMDHSASDYHHSQPPKSQAAPPMPAKRSQSQYSIMNDEHLRPSHSFIEPPPSVSSYDPYRASKNPIFRSQNEYLNVTVHRSGSTTTRRASIGRSLRHPNHLRIEVLKTESQRKSISSSSSLPRSRQSRASMPRSSGSKISVTSSSWASSPPVIATMRPYDLHKRGVSFSRIRRTSTTSAVTSSAPTTNQKSPATPAQPDTMRRKQAKDEAHLHDMSPSEQAAQVVRSRKVKAHNVDRPGPKLRRPYTPTQHMRSEIRKHSAELEKACEEAFFRTSTGSSNTARTSLTDAKPVPYDTPPSSVSARGSGGSTGPAQNPMNRPLAELRKDTPTTYLTRTLEETREKLAAYKTPNDDNTGKFEEVMRMLESIMPTSSPVPATEDMRSFTAPATKSPDHLGFLPIISEESSDRQSGKEGGNWHRSVTAPVRQQRSAANDRTIRVVPPTSPTSIAPLNIRKRSVEAQSSDNGQRRLQWQTSAEHHFIKHPADHVGGLTAIEEDSELPATPNLLRKKKSGWFGLKKAEPDARLESPASVSFGDDWKMKHARPLSAKEKVDKVWPCEPPLSTQSSEFPMRKNRFRGGKRGFGKWLSRTAGDKREIDDTETTDATTRPNATTRSLDSLFSAGSLAPESSDSPPTPGPERSWFARFFHIRPATRALCFSVPRGRARQELVILLREWQRHGVRDLQYSRETNTITARVDKQNSLDIKPVAFRIELFVVLEHGRKVGLSIARFVQVKGAASGFKRVLEVVDGVMRGRGWLVEDEEKWKALCEVVGA